MPGNPPCRGPRATPPTGLKASNVTAQPTVLGTTAADLDTITALDRRPVTALFVAGAAKITPLADVAELHALALRVAN